MQLITVRVEDIVGFLPLNARKRKVHYSGKPHNQVINHQLHGARSETVSFLSLSLSLFMIVNAHKVQGVVNFPNYVCVYVRAHARARGRQNRQSLG